MIKEKFIKLKKQPKWVARTMFGMGAVLGLGLALHMLPISGSRADNEIAPSNYIHEVEVDEINTITICDPNDSTACITMMDRNLGAENNDINSTGSWGYHYQWGNNHGFLSCYTSGCNTWYGGDGKTGIQVDASSYGPENGYSGGNFIYGFVDWSSVKNDNLRGGSGDSAENNRGYDIINHVAINVTDRQGPCPEGYHVPSLGEWNKTLEYWVEENKDLIPDERLVYHENGLFSLANNVYICYDENGHKTDCVPEGNVDMEYLNYDNEFLLKIQQDFKIPFAGLRVGDSTQIGVMGINAHLWSSSPATLGFDSARSFELHTGGVGTTVTVGRAGGLSVRCFKNSSEVLTTFSISIDDNINVGKYTTFTIKAMKNGQLFRNYTGSIILTLTNKNGALINKRYYTLSNSGRYTFASSDQGIKTFYNGLKINQTGTYIIEVSGLDDDFRGSATINVLSSHSAANFEYDTLKFNPYFSDEMNQAFQYSHYYGITTKNTIKEADMYSGLTRIAMAKMLVNYAENVLEIDSFDSSKNCTFTDVPNYLDKEYGYGVKKACQLGIMGVNMPENKFYPNGGVTRAEFATALSRLLYNTKDGVSKYYSTHITKLFNEGIITNTDPTLKELRGYVMLMLKRAAE